MLKASPREAKEMHFLEKFGKKQLEIFFFCKCVGSATVGVGPNSEAAAAIFPDQVLLFERKREKMRWNYGILHSSFESCFSCLGLGRGEKVSDFSSPPPSPPP